MRNSQLIVMWGQTQRGVARVAQPIIIIRQKLLASLALTQVIRRRQS